MRVGAEERDVLSQLTGFVVFAGRYPIPTKAKDLTAKLLPARRGKWPPIEFAPGTVIWAQTRAHLKPCLRGSASGSHRSLAPSSNGLGKEGTVMGARRAKDQPTWSDREVFNILVAVVRPTALTHRGMEALSAWGDAMCTGRNLPAARREFQAAAAEGCGIAQEQRAEATTTPEDTLRGAGVSSKRQARYQRRMSTVLSGRQDGAR